MVVRVDPNKIARAMAFTEPTVATPAPEQPETNLSTKSIPPTSPVDASTIAQAIAASRAIDQAPARKPGRARVETQSKGASPAPEANVDTTSTEKTPPADPVLFTIRQLGRLLDDIERMRIMNSNRIGAGQRGGIDQPWMDTVAAQLDTLEHTVELELKRAWRKHPLAPWAKAIPGAGEVLMGRLIAEIGDPAERPNPAKLWAYCGHGDPARAGKIPKGATQEELFKRGSPHAKKAVWKLAYQFMRTVGSGAIPRSESEVAPPPQENGAKIRTEPSVLTRRSPRSPYRDIYDARKTATEGKLHDKPCVRCGPAGHPAQAGSPWSDAHRHADALRIVGKEFLKDLWVAAREVK
jgi:hypothetical protein